MVKSNGLNTERYGNFLEARGEWHLLSERIEEALADHRRAVRIFETSIGVDHPKTAKARDVCRITESLHYATTSGRKNRQIAVSLAKNAISDFLTSRRTVEIDHERIFNNSVQTGLASLATQVDQTSQKTRSVTPNDRTKS